MSDSLRLEAPRRRLSGQQAGTVDRLTAAGLEILSGPDAGALSVREVARRARVAPATAYSYFSSKEHLVAVVFWRRLASLPEPTALSEDELTASDDEVTARVLATLRQIATVVAGAPNLAAATNAALLGADPEVRHLRVRIGAEIRRRIVVALAGNPDVAIGQELPDGISLQVVEALELVYAGASLFAGMGVGSYEDMADKMIFAARKIMEHA